MTKHYTHEHDQEIAQLYQAGQTTYEIAAVFGISPTPVTRALERQGVPLRRGGRRTTWTGTPEQKAAVVAAYLEGESIRRIAQRLAVRATCIIEALNEASIDRRHRGKQPMLDDETAREIAEAYQAGEKLTGLAARYNVSYITIRNYLVKQGIEMRPAHKSVFWTEERKAEAARRYQAGENQQEIAAVLRCSQHGVSNILRRLGVLARGPYRRREGHPSWNGGRTLTEDGYVRVKLPDEYRHLFPDIPANGYVLEHRLVMARHLGRPLHPDENVHHKRDNAENDLEHLELWTSSQPSGRRVEEIVAWAAEMLIRYAPEALVPGWQELPLPEAVT